MQEPISKICCLSLEGENEKETRKNNKNKSAKRKRAKPEIRVWEMGKNAKDGRRCDSLAAFSLH